MIHKMFTIHDLKARAYLPPFFLPEEGMAKRTFADCVNSDSHQFSMHPEDYTLFMLGTWDDSTSQAQLNNAAISLGNGIEFRLDLVQELQQDGPLTQSKEARHAETHPEKTSLSNEPPILPGPESHNSQE